MITPSTNPSPTSLGVEWTEPMQLLAAAGLDFEIVHSGEGAACDRCPCTLDLAA